MRPNRIFPSAPDGTGRIIACRSCHGYLSPGWVRVPEADASAPGGARWVWERCPARCTPETRAAAVAAELTRRGVRVPANPEDNEHQEVRDVSTTPAPAPAAAPESAVTPAPVSAAPVPQVRRAARRQESPTLVSAVAVDVADGQLLADVADIEATAPATLAGLMQWIGEAGPALGVARLHADVRGSDGTVVLSAAALSAAKLPKSLPSTPAALERAAAKVRKAAGAAGLETGDGFGAGFKVWRKRGGEGPRMSVKVIVAPWLGQGDDAAQAFGALVTALAADSSGAPDALTLARRLRGFVADLGVTPGATTAVTSRHLLESCRPRFTWTRDDAGAWHSEVRPDALPDGDTCVPVAAGARHPLTRERLAGRLPVCEEEDYKWWVRPLSPEESGQPYAVAVDACASYLAVTERAELPAGPLEHTASPVWDARKAGLWWADFTGLPVEEELPHFATFTGKAPTGPGWYATPTVEYAVKAYGFDPSTITEAYVATHTVAFLKEWSQHVRAAYLSAMEALGVPATLAGPEFVRAWDRRKDVTTDAGRDALVLVDAYKGIYKGGVGKWADAGRARYGSDDDAWLADVAAAWHYRPEVRFTIIASARIAGHRRMRKTLELTGLAPFAVNVDQLMYAAPAADLSALLAVRDDGKPVPGTVRLGCAPGSYKWDAAVPMAAVRELLAQELHPSRATHDYDVTGAPVITLGV